MKRIKLLQLIIIRMCSKLMVRMRKKPIGSISTRFMIDRSKPRSHERYPSPSLVPFDDYDLALPRGPNNRALVSHVVSGKASSILFLSNLEFSPFESR